MSPQFPLLLPFCPGNRKNIPGHCALSAAEPCGRLARQKGRVGGAHGNLPGSGCHWFWPASWAVHGARPASPFGRHPGLITMPLGVTQDFWVSDNMLTVMTAHN